MNLSELKAIDSRLKRVAAGESRGEIYRHEYDPNKSRCQSVDCIALLNALYDPTPIDDAWLEDLGFYGIGWSGRELTHENAPFMLWIKERPNLIEVYQDIDQAGYLRTVTTRGQLLFLLLGLGVFDE